MEDVYVTTPTVHDDYVGTPAQGIAYNIAVMQRRVLAISSTMAQQGGVVPSQLVTELRSLRASLVELVEVQRCLNPAPIVSPSAPAPAPVASVHRPSVHAVVPVQLPYFQWTGHVYDSTRTVFPTLKACVNKFEDVLNTYQLDFNDHWCRLLPLCLSFDCLFGKCAWLAEFTSEFPEATWSDFRVALNNQYGITQDADQEAATTDLLALFMSRHQPIETFIDKFQDLKRRSGWTDPSSLCLRFVSALTVELATQVHVALATAPVTTKRNLSFVMALARELYNKLYVRPRRDAADAHASSSNAHRVEKRHSGGRSHRHPASARDSRRDSGSSSSSTAASAPGANEIYCTYHKSFGNHTTDSCRALIAARANYVNSGPGQSSAPATSSPRTKYCHHCRASNWSPGHVCAKGKAVENSVRYYGKPAAPGPGNELTQRAMRRSSPSSSSHVEHRAQRSTPPVPITELTFVDDDEDDDMEDISKKCKPTKTININNEPSIPSRTHSILLPITIQNHQTWAYLDTGSNFSAIKPSLVQRLGFVLVTPEPNKNISSHTHKNSYISLGHKNNSVQRVGFINNVKVFYNNITLHHTFEVFDIHTDICIGLDLMSRLNISINGLVTHWDDSTLPTIEDPIDPLPNTPNYEYFGTESIRTEFMTSIKNELDDNTAIDPFSVCTIPNSEFKIVVPENTVVFRKQYPLPLKHKDDLSKQLDTWLADGTITVAEPNNPHNYDI
ncbi:hypothetical protein HPULCUR_001674 [Helicostylum pulchrum]|uniref:Retrotransposon gag domain-containing protein n=1 Tax=Helicostylum pulchrum TaxID=562976 RepID=A0ABP9XNF3_9FUNG